MEIDWLLQITFATLVSLGTLLLGMGQRSLTLPMVAILAATVSIYVTDLHGWIRLNKLVANLAAMLAVVLSVSDFFHVSSEEQLLAVANLLVYLQVVLMFQKKTGRMYWQLMMLNVLQVVVGAALDLDMLFGVLLVVYLFVALAAMNLLFIQRESERWQRLAGVKPRVAIRARSAGKGEKNGALMGEATNGGGTSLPSLTSHPRPRSAELAASLSRKGRGRDAQTSLVPRPSPFAHRPSSLVPDPPRAGGSAIHATAVLPADPAVELLGSGVFRRTAGTGLGTLVVAAICFFSLPRFGQSMWTGGVTNQHTASVGFSPDVKLGDLGPLLQNPELAMRITFRNKATDEAFLPTGSPLLRGSLVTEYRHGVWKHAAIDSDKSVPEQLQSLPNSAGGLLQVRQQIMIEPMSEPVVFAVYPAFEDPERPNRHILYDVDRQQLVRTSEVQHDKFEYNLLTIGLTDTDQCRILPQREPMDPADIERMLALPDDKRGPNDESTGVADPDADPAERLTGLRKFAAKVVRDANLAPTDAYGKAKALERALSSEPFRYSLNRPPPAPNVDPIEDFVVRNHAGHCEYFASALALMLRSQGIPARLVIGFRGGEKNPLGSFLDVRQLNAHAWVEAYLHRQDIPNDMRPRGFSMRNGAWLVLDSTPESATAAADDDSWLTSLEDLSDYVSQLWNSYIIGLNPDRQRQSIYMPLAEGGSLMKSIWMSIEASAESLARRVGHFWGRNGSADDSDGPDWALFLLLVSLITGTIAMYLLARRWIRRWIRRGSRDAAQLAAGMEVPFYRRFEAILARRGIVRRAGQTQRELAQTAAAAWSAMPDGRAAGQSARRIVDAFYRVRFGRVALDSRQAATVEQLLDQLQTSAEQTGLARRR